TGNTLAASTGASTRELMNRLGHASSQGCASLSACDRRARAGHCERLVRSRARGTRPAATDRCERRRMCHERAMGHDLVSGESWRNPSPPGNFASGRRESNSRPQLGNEREAEFGGLQRTGPDNLPSSGGSDEQPWRAADEAGCALNVPWREVTVRLPLDVAGALENAARALGVSLETLVRLDCH